MRQIFLIAILCCFCCRQTFAAGVMGIDFGTDWFKVALIKPGIPLEVVLNKDSKRKTEAQITIRDGARYFGSDAGLRSPEDRYAKLKDLLGRKYKDPAAVEYRKLYDNAMDEIDARGTVGFHDRNSKSVLPVEELVANILAHAKQQCDIFAGESVRDVVITVPPFWGQHERRALLEAAEVAGLRVLSLINDETAVALNYAMTRQFDFDPQYHIFFDMGAGSTVAALVSFRNIAEKVSQYSKSKKNTTVIEVKAIGYDPTLGGHAIDLRIQQYLAQQFDSTVGKKQKVDVFSSQKAMAKLLREAERVKLILSANQETTASVEGLINDIDFRTTVTRAQLEKMSEDLIGRVPAPIDMVLQKTNLTMNDIQSFILVGGGMRVPAIQQKLQEIVGNEKIAKHVNADEAAVLGAAYRGADLSPQFRVRSFKINDIVLHPVEIEFPKENDVFVRQTVYSSSAHLGSRRKITFKRRDDFLVSLVNNGSLEQDLFKVEIKGVGDAVGKFASEITEGSEPKVKLFMTMTQSGILEVEKAAVEIETKEPEGDSLADKVMSFFGGGESKQNNETEAEDTSESSDPTSTGNTTETDSAANSTLKSSVQQVQLTTIINFLHIKPLTDEEKMAMKERIAKMDAEDAKRKAHDEARNNLESYIYSSTDFLDSKAAQKASVETERDELMKSLFTASEWLSDNGESPSVSTNEFIDRLTLLRNLRSPIDKRIREAEKRPEAEDKLKAVLKEVQDYYFQHLTNLSADARLLGETDFESILKTAKETLDWLDGLSNEQTSLPPYKDPVLLVSDLYEHTRTLEQELQAVKIRRKTLLASVVAAKASAAKSASSASADTTKTVESTVSASETNSQSTEPTPMPTGKPYHEEL